MKCHDISKALIFAVCALVPAISIAETPGLFSIIESKPISELWLNPGFYSYHVQSDKDLESKNFGLGGEYRYSTSSSVTLGMFENSHSLTSHYAGWYWQPLGIGPVRVGAVVGAVNGYPMWNGDWFIAVIPTVSLENEYFGANLLLIPTYQDKIYGSISLQLKLRVF